MRKPLSVALFLLGAAVALPSVARADGIRNPSGIVLERTAAFEVSVEPAAFPDAAIHWSADPESRVSFPDGTNGRIVTVRGEVSGDVALRVGIKGYAGEEPVFNARVVPATTVKADAWVIRDGNNWARTEAEVRGLFDDANEILSQVGVSISLDSIHSTNRHDWFDFNPRQTGWTIPNQITTVTNGTGGLVYYFVWNIDHYQGLRSGANILVERDGTGETAAHEACHVFGLSDIYAWDDESPLVLDPTMPLQRNHLPMDWGSDSECGFYSPNLTQSNIVERLLMLGRGNTNAVDIPRGDIWGVWYEWTREPGSGRYVKSWHESLAPVGFFEHANTSPFLK